jgi:hypothetical protein
MNTYPLYLAVAFALTAFVCIYLFYRATRNNTKVLLLISVWLVIQAIISIPGFYTITNTMPPRFLLLVLPPLLLVIVLFVTKRGKRFLDSLDVRLLTLLHVVRVPVELVLFGLFTYEMVPRLMTFEGMNFDILSGITAPVLFYLVFLKRRIDQKWLLVWNCICLLLLINIVTIAVLSAPFPFQQLAFDQPNIGVLYFPFVWLPCCVVPLVLLSHLAAIRILLRKQLPEKAVSLAFR